MNEKALINAISYYLPEKVLTNEDISTQHPEWTVDKITSKIGIQTRHIASEQETASDLAFFAAMQLFEENKNIKKEDIDYVILCTQSPDYFLPSSACILQHRLGLSKTCGAFDFNLGCSGYIYGLGIAKGLILSNQASNILLLTGETYSKYIHKDDKGNKTIFGDAGTASLISSFILYGGINACIENFAYGTDGSQGDALIVRNGCAKYSSGNSVFKVTDSGDYLSNDDSLYMDGKAIFNFTAFQVPPLIKKVLEKNSMELLDIDRFIFHQANEFMLTTVRKRCNIPEEKFYIDIRDIGNTVSNTIPIALKRAFDEGLFLNDKNLLLAGFGVGLSMGSVILKLQ